MAFISDHVDRGLARILEQYRDKPAFEAFLKALLAQVQGVEDMWNELVVERLLDNAVGAQLDVYGRVVGELRKGKTDAQYRVRLQARLRVNRSRGQIGDLLAVARTLVGTAGDVRYQESYPAAAEVYLDADSDEESGIESASIIREAKPAGVRLLVRYRGAGARFRFGGGAIGSGRGFGVGKLGGSSA